MKNVTLMKNVDNYAACTRLAPVVGLKDCQLSDRQLDFSSHPVERRELVNRVDVLCGEEGGGRRGVALADRTTCPVPLNKTAPGYSVQSNHTPYHCKRHSIVRG